MFGLRRKKINIVFGTPFTKSTEFQNLNYENMIEEMNKINNASTDTICNLINAEFKCLVSKYPYLKHSNNPECFNIAKGIAYYKYNCEDILKIDWHYYISFCDSHGI